MPASVEKRPTTLASSARAVGRGRAAAWPRAAPSTSTAMPPIQAAIAATCSTLAGEHQRDRAARRRVAAERRAAAPARRAGRRARAAARARAPGAPDEQPGGRAPAAQTVPKRVLEHVARRRRRSPPTTATCPRPARPRAGSRSTDASAPAAAATQQQRRARRANASVAAAQPPSPGDRAPAPGSQHRSRNSSVPRPSAIAAYWTPRAIAERGRRDRPGVCPRSRSVDRSRRPRRPSPTVKVKPPETGCESAETTR